jgi:hypothetical protein
MWKYFSSTEKQLNYWGSRHLSVLSYSMLTLYLSGQRGNPCCSVLQNVATAINKTIVLFLFPFHQYFDSWVLSHRHNWFLRINIYLTRWIPGLETKTLKHRGQSSQLGHITCNLRLHHTVSLLKISRNFQLSTSQPSAVSELVLYQIRSSNQKMPHFLLVIWKHCAYLLYANIIFLQEITIVKNQTPKLTNSGKVRPSSVIISITEQK